MSQLHFDPATYAEFIRVEIPRYDYLQESIATAAASVAAAVLTSANIAFGNCSQTARSSAAIVSHPNLNM